MQFGFKMVPENRNFLCLLCFDLDVFGVYWCGLLKRRLAFAFKQLVAELRGVTRPLLMQKWATFYP